MKLPSQNKACGALRTTTPHSTSRNYSSRQLVDASSVGTAPHNCIALHPLSSLYCCYKYSPRKTCTAGPTEGFWPALPSTHRPCRPRSVPCLTRSEISSPTTEEGRRKMRGARRKGGHDLPLNLLLMRKTGARCLSTTRALLPPSFYPWRYTEQARPQRCLWHEYACCILNQPTNRSDRPTESKQTS